LASMGPRRRSNRGQRSDKMQENRHSMTRDRIEISSIRSLDDIEDYFDEIESGGQPLPLAHQRAEEWFEMNRRCGFGRHWPSETARVRYLAKRINQRIRYHLARNEIEDFPSQGPGTVIPDGIGGWHFENKFTQEGAEWAIRNHKREWRR